MKKRIRRKEGFASSAQSEPHMTGLLVRIQQQLAFLEKKIDSLVGQSQGRPVEKQYNTKSFQRFDHSRSRGETRQDNNYVERRLHKAICADCNKECEVPFRPSQDRPVYCRDCFSRRKGGGSFKGNVDDRNKVSGSSRESHLDKPQEDGKNGSFGKKRPAVKRRKTRA